jgi:alkanesulfonate monooxygenase SsuD/methylene tetrahydromethanopterin reductase-like flavin-dependent oxidoreductase (luciferase family)
MARTTVHSEEKWRKPAMRMRVLLEPHHGASYDQIRALAQATEAAGFDAFFRSDHYLGIDPDDTGYRPTDSWTTLAGLTTQTERVRLGTLMTASTYRQPGPLAITVATVDAMSGGRAELGIGAAWYEREHRFFGIPFPPLGERFADEFNSGMSDGLADRFANFRRFCARAGRDPAEVRLSTTLPVCCGRTRGEAARRAATLGEAGARMLQTGVTGTPGDVAARLAELRAAGADTVYFHLYDVADLDHVGLLGREVLPWLD